MSTQVPVYKYRLYDETEVYTGFRTLRKPEAIDVPSTQREGVYSGFQGDLNPIYTEGSIIIKYLYNTTTV